MNEFEELLWKQLEEYKEKKDFMSIPEGINVVRDKEVWEHTKKAEYVYKCFTMWDGHKNQDGNYEKVHILIPKEDFDLWELDKKYSNEGIPEIVPINKKRMYFATKEVVEKDE
jgi:hypothetical protein